MTDFHVKSLHDIEKHVQAEARRGRPPGRFVFRGQPKDWSLSTSLERACHQMDGPRATKPLDRAPQREKAFLRDFKRRAHHYLSDLPGPEHMWEWLALMLHYTGPTRLLDCTYSLYVATHFAIQRSESSERTTPGNRPRSEAAIVWMFDAEWCKHATMSTLPKNEQEMLKQEVTFENEPAVAKVLLSHVARYVYPVNPFRLNDRLTIQRGVFLWPGDVTRSFQDNLDAMLGRHDPGHVIRYVIPPTAFGPITGQLHAMNISDATLFPGLEGFARSLVGARRFLEDQRPDIIDSERRLPSRLKGDHQ